MSASITNKLRLESTKKFIQDNFNSSGDGIYSYFFIGRNYAWPDENSPPPAHASYNDIHNILVDRIFLKNMVKSDTILGIKRFNWITDTVYTRADYDADYKDFSNWIHPESPFYVINSEGNVYKCISNNNNIPSTVEPTGQLLGYTFLSDGYQWKFMYDLSILISDKFNSTEFIPVPYDTVDKTVTHIDVENSAVYGDISFIRLDENGSGYSTVPDIVIEGDGVGATAVAIMNGESIDYISMSDNGSGYTHATVYIYGNGIDGACTAMVSPDGGHGSDASAELGAFFVLMATEIIGDEDTIAPITGTYRTLGIVRNTLDNTGNVISSPKYNTLSDINIINSTGDYQINEMVIGESSLTTGYVYEDPSGVDKTIVLNNIEGDFIDGENIRGQISGIFGKYNELASIKTTVDLLSGDMLYIENIMFVSRREIQTEKFIFSIEF